MTAAASVLPAGRASPDAGTSRFLHVVDVGTSCGAGSAAAAIALMAGADRGVTHELLLLGTRGDAEIAARAGFPPGRTIAPLLGDPLWSRRAIAAIAAERGATAPAGCDVVAWGEGALAVLLDGSAPRSGGSRLAFVAAIGPSKGRAARSIRASLASGAAPPAAIAWSEAAARETNDVLGIEARLVPPPAIQPTLTPVAAAHRDRLRWSWGASESTFVVGLASDPVEWGDARRACEITGFARLQGRDVLLVLHPASARLAATQAWVNELGLASMLRTDRRMAEPWAVIGALDAVLCLGDGVSLAGAAARRAIPADPFALLPTSLAARAASPAPLAWAMALGRPVLADATAVAGWGWGAGVLAFPSDDPLAATRTLLTLIADPSARAAAAESVRHGCHALEPRRVAAGWRDAFASA